MKHANTLQEAREIGATLGEYSPPEIRAQDDRVLLRFVAYTPGARDGKFHHYKYLSIPTSVFEQMQDEKLV